MKYTGKCLCGEVTYTADAPPVVVAQCHCEECRRLSGTGHTVGAMFVSRVVTVNGKLREFSYSLDNVLCAEYLADLASGHCRVEASQHVQSMA